MPHFHYKAIDETGREVAGEWEAGTRDEAVDQLGARRLTVQTIEVRDEPHGAANADRIRESDVATIAEFLSGAADSQLPLESGLRALSDEIPDRRMRAALRRVCDRLSAGESLQSILESGRAPRPLLDLLRAGLATERLGSVLEAWLACARRAADVRRRIWIGLAYPLLLTGALIVMVVFLMVFLVPDVARAFEDFGTQFPAVTRWTIGLSRLMTEHAWLVLPGLAGVTALLVFGWFLVEKSRRRQIVCCIPIVGPAVRHSALSSFCHLLAYFVECGVAMPAALRAAGAGSRDAEIERASREMADDVERGRSLEESARSRRSLPFRLAHVFRWSNRAAAFPAALHASGDMFEGDARLRAQMVSLIVEPLVIAAVAVVFAGVTIALLFPLIRLISDLT